MKKLEVVMNQSIEEDFLAMCKRKQLAKAYTKLSDVQGCGLQVPKMGTPIWPQMNIMFIIVCSAAEIEEYKQIILQLRLKFPDDGVFASVSEATVI